MSVRAQFRGSTRVIRRAASGIGSVFQVGLALCLGLANVGCSDSGIEPVGGPEVTTVSPEAGTAAAPVVGSVIAWFSKPLDAGALDEAIALEADGREVRGQVASRDASTLEFVPSDPLDFGTSYRATVRSWVKDLDGTALGADYSWTFTTQGSPLPALSRDSLSSYIRVLADDSLMGRAAGTAEELLAAQYLATRFGDWGLGPLLTNFVQPFTAPSRTGRMLDSRNVLAVVSGAGALAGEWVIVGAHYDAQGVISDGAGGVLVRNGADDNGSGTAMVLELARLYSRWVSLGGTAGVARRAVLFAGFGSEEEGLIGSCQFVGADLIPSPQMAAMVNFDMVGRLRDNTVTAQRGGSSDSWDDMLENSNTAGLFVNPDPACKASCSDYGCFASRNVPYVWFYTGSHSQYHRPEDDEPLIDYDGMLAIGNMAFRVLTRLTVAPGRPASGARVPLPFHTP